MCEPQVVMDRERWTAAMGLGFFLVRSGPRTYVGHTGGMPGILPSDRRRATVVLPGGAGRVDVRECRGFACVGHLAPDVEHFDAPPVRGIG